MRLLPLSLLALTLACSGEHASVAEPAPSDADPLPPLIEPSPWPGSFDAPRAEDDDEAPDVVAVTLEAIESEVEIASGHRVRLWTYNRSLPGPTIEARVGDTIRVHLRNSLPEATTIHWHGLRIPAAMDGVMATQS